MTWWSCLSWKATASTAVYTKMNYYSTPAELFVLKEIHQLSCLRRDKLITLCSTAAELLAHGICILQCTGISVCTERKDSRAVCPEKQHLEKLLSQRRVYDNEPDKLSAFKESSQPRGLQHLGKLCFCRDKFVEWTSRAVCAIKKTTNQADIYADEFLAVY
jgi:hypothetical protein